MTLNFLSKNLWPPVHLGPPFRRKIIVPFWNIWRQMLWMSDILHLTCSGSLHIEQKSPFIQNVNKLSNTCTIWKNCLLLQNDASPIPPPKKNKQTNKHFWTILIGSSLLSKSMLLIGGLAVVAFWQSPHGPLGSGPPRAGYSQRRKRKEKGKTKGPL